MEKYPKGSKVEIVWLDAQDHSDTWVDEEDAEKFGEVNCEVTSIGYVVSHGSKYLTLGSDFDRSDRDFGTVRKIPLGMIVSIQLQCDAVHTTS